MQGGRALEDKDKTDWLDAYFDCIKHKLSAPQCTEYRINFEKDLWALMTEVKTRIYNPTTLDCFVVSKPKYREIFAAGFRDRIVQHWITLRIEPLLEERFVSQGDVSFNCRKGYGTLLATQVAGRHIEEVTQNYHKTAYIGKFDICGFFMSIDKDLLLSLLIPFIKEKYQGDDLDTLLYLTEITVKHEPEKLCVRKSPEELWEKIPPKKSLFYSQQGIGMAIGNITSQLLANFYLSFFDEFVLNECKKHNARYIRFVDDFLIICTDKHFIIDMHKRATQWFGDNLHLKLHQDKFYLQEAKKGVKFVGSVCKLHRRYTANRTVANFTTAIHKTELLCKNIIENGLNLQNAKLLESKIANLNSYNGFIVHNNSYNLRRRLFSNKPYFWQCCYMKGKHFVIKIKSKYRYKYLIINQERSYDERTRNEEAREDRGRNKMDARTKNPHNQKH